MIKKIRYSMLPLILVIAASVIIIPTRLLPLYAKYTDKTPPVITVWYGQHQHFGQNGLAQRWVNVLGNASDPQSSISKLSYRLNGGAPVAMRMGPANRRLWLPGDFDVELDPNSLRAGDNQVSITAVNGSGQVTTTQVTVTFQHKVPKLPYVIDWSKVKDLQQVLQVVDGKWQWDANGIRPVELGYDRMLALGDTSWTNYMITVPVTVHGFDEAAFNEKESGNHAGISVDLRWLGHSNDPVVCAPPHCGWNPVGDFNKYFYKPNGDHFLGLKVKEKQDNFPTLPYEFHIGHTYIFKASVQTTAQGNLYRMKVWEQGTPEPAKWMFEQVAVPGSGPEDNPPSGGIALVAHHSDVTFGNVTVTPLP